MVVFQVTRTLHRNWRRQSFEIVVQVADEDVEKIVERIKIEDRKLNVYVEERILECYKCIIKGFIIVDSTRPLVRNKGRTERN